MELHSRLNRSSTLPATSAQRALRNRPRRPTLRSSLVYAASREIPNRFQLCQTISKAARVLHLANHPTESTINRVLQNISHPASELEAKIPEAVL
jgi:hypothetical protein